jgi:integrase
VAEDMLATAEADWKNAKHRQQWRNTLKTYAAPLHDKAVDVITTDDVAAVLRPIWTEKPETASRLRGRMERVFSVAKARKLRSGENPAAWRDNLQPLFGKRKRLTRGHHCALPYRNAKDFTASLRRGQGVAALALELTILTAARTGEVIGARWPEIDLEAKVWTVPAVRMKAGKEHRVPLSARAVVILETVAKLKRDHDGFIFPGQSADGSLANMAMAAVLKRMKREDITVHGFRSTFRDWAGEVSSFPNEVCEMALAHTIQNKAEKAYRRGDLLDKRRPMMQAWADYCEPAAPALQAAE